MDRAMDRRAWERLAAATGIGFVVLIVVAIFLAPQPPELADPAAEIQTYFVDNKDGILLQSFVFGLAGILFLWFVGTLRSFLRPSEPGTGRLSAIAFGGGVAILAAVVPQTAVNSALAYSVARESDQALVRALFEIQHMLSIFAAFPAAVLLAAVFAVTYQHRALPGWLGWSAGILALAHVVVGMAVFIEGSELGPTGWFGQIVFALFLAWILVASIVMMQRLARPAM